MKPHIEEARRSEKAANLVTLIYSWAEKLVRTATGGPDESVEE